MTTRLPRLLLMFAPLAAFAVAADLAHADWTSEVSSSNPLHWFRFEETAGTTADDQGSADVDGTYVGGYTLGTTGLVGNAVSLDGASHVLVSGPDLATDWTLETIFKADVETGGVSQGIIGSDFTAADRMAVKAEQWNETGQLGYTVFGVIDVTLPPATPTDYSHVVFTGSGSGVDVYVDGSLVGGDTVSTPLARYVIGAGAIRADGSLVDGLTGMIDEVVIYDRILSVDEISAHYAAVPEPATGVLAMMLGLLALSRCRRR